MIEDTRKRGSMAGSKQKIDPTILIIFGATGDLSRQRLIPALFHLSEHELLPKRFHIVGFARSEMSHEQFRKHVGGKNTSNLWKKFAKKILYLSGNFSNSKDFQRLKEKLSVMEEREHSCTNHLFYFSTLPSHYETIAHQLAKAGLLTACKIHKRETRIVIEKPFGYDFKTAQKLDQTLGRYFHEKQIYRIDHYLGKETVQNLLTIRFANSIFEPIWNRNFVDHVQISAIEERGIANRGALYEKSGAIRDVVQNHLMQILSLIAMEQPADLTTEAIRNERAKVIAAIQKPSSKEIGNSLVTGQYQGFDEEPKIAKKSKTETFAAVKLFLENSRWAQVPFYLRTGKKLAKKITQISIHFKQPIPALFESSQPKPNALVFEIQPNEGILLNLTAKFPGFGIRLHPVTMELGYHSAFKGEFPEAYERLLLDFMEGDQRLFARSDEIEHSWKYVDVLENYLKKMQKRPQIYTSGSWGPSEAEKLIAKDKREWHIA